MKGKTIDSIQLEFVESLFQGKEGSNNEAILKELVKEDKGLSFHAISHRTRMKYNTTIGRITALEKEGLLQSTIRPASQNKKMIPFWRLSPLGWWVAAHKYEEARDRCGKLLSKYWMEFASIYGLDRIEGLESTCREIASWFEYEDGLMEVLDQLSWRPLSSKVDALCTFRDMMQLSLLLGQHAIPGGTELPAPDPDVYESLRKLATRHESFRKLDSALLDVNSPLRDYFADQARQELISRLTPSLERSDAERLSLIPLLEEAKSNIEGRYAAHLALSLMEQGSFEKNGTQLIVEDEGITIKTKESGRISDEWKDYCDIEVDLGSRRIPARRKRS